MGGRKAGVRTLRPSSLVRIFSRNQEPVRGMAICPEGPEGARCTFSRPLPIGVGIVTDG